MTQLIFCDSGVTYRKLWKKIWNRCWRFTRLPFGLSLAPWCFTQTATPSGSLPPRLRGVSYYLLGRSVTYGTVHRDSTGTPIPIYKSPPPPGFPGELGEIGPHPIHHHRVLGLHSRFSDGHPQFATRQTQVHSQGDQVALSRSSDHYPQFSQGDWFVSCLHSSHFSHAASQLGFAVA